jgi:hypothetical protein
LHGGCGAGTKDDDDHDDEQDDGGCRQPASNLSSQLV